MVIYKYICGPTAKKYVYNCQRPLKAGVKGQGVAANKPKEKSNTPLKHYGEKLFSRASRKFT